MRILFLSVILLMAGSSVSLAATVAVKPFAVVELFGSEGCSSCPPADDFLTRLTAWSKHKNLPVYTLSFQVDYWNSSQWSDPFSSLQFTQRQQRYSALLPGGVYTPEMIINGRDAFVGSDEGKAQGFIEHYLKLQPDNGIELRVEFSGNVIKANYRCVKQEPHSVINVAIVERGLENHVTGGENSGMTLKHDNVVREFKTVDLNEVSGQINLFKPAQADLTRFSVIAYVQSKDDMSISAASGVDLK